MNYLITVEEEERIRNVLFTDVLDQIEALGRYQDNWFGLHNALRITITEVTNSEGG